MSTHVEAEPSNVTTSGGEQPNGARSALVVALAGSIIFWIGLPFPVVFDFFEAEDSAARIALINDNRTQFAIAFGLLGLGAAIAGIGLWMLGRAIAPMEARRGRRSGIAANVAAWLGLVGALGGASRLLHGVFATPEYGEDNLIDPVIGGIAWIATGIAFVIFGVLAWSAPPPKWTAVVLVLGGVAGTVTFLPLFWYTALIVFAIANLVVMQRRATSPTTVAAR